MDTIVLLRYLHVIGATVLLGTGVGIAFFMLMAHRTGDPRLIAHVAATVVIADAIFTATAVIAQPVTGVFLANAMGWNLTEGWIVTSHRSVHRDGTVLATRRVDPDANAAPRRKCRPLSRAALHRFTTACFAFGSPAGSRPSRPSWPSSG